MYGQHLGNIKLEESCPEPVLPLCIQWPDREVLLIEHGQTRSWALSPMPHPLHIHPLLLTNSSHTLSPIIHRHVQDTPARPAPWIFTDTLKPAITGDAQLGAQESESGESQGLVTGTHRAAR